MIEPAESIGKAEAQRKHAIRRGRERYRFTRAEIREIGLICRRASKQIDRGDLALSRIGVLLLAEWPSHGKLKLHVAHAGKACIVIYSVPADRIVTFLPGR